MATPAEAQPSVSSPSPGARERAARFCRRFGLRVCQTARKRDPVSAPNRDPHRRLRSGRPRSPWRGPARDAQCPHKRRSGARGEALWTPGGDPRWARTVGSGAVFEAPALVAGFENVAVMGQAIEQRRRHLGVAEYARPFGEGEICRQDDRGALVKAADQVEQHLPAADREWQVTQLVEDDENDADELIGEAPGFSGTRFGLQLIDQVDCGEEPNARAVAHAIGADRYRYMALAGAGAADQHGIALGDQKATLVQLAHQPLVDRRDREVELGEVLHDREAGHP